MATPIIERFWSKVVVNEITGCWLWTANTTPLGYGLLWSRERQQPVYAHRLAYETYVGPIGQNLTLDHQCRNPSCCNPNHLKPMSLKENILLGIGFSAKNARKTHCPSGHPYNELNTYLPKRGGRGCRICQRETNRRTKQRKKASE